jgi:uncharacterized protein YgiM (DUF1202 family)
LKLAVAGGVLGLTAWAVAAAVVPRMSDPQQTLTRAAKSVAAGPSNPNDLARAKSDFDKAVMSFLKSFGSLPPAELTQKLQQGLVSNAFEVHVFELPRGLKVVEIDTVLQACDYLLMKSDKGTKVYPLNGVEVFDNAQIITEGAPVLVLLSHTSGQGPHHPLVRVLGLLPDDVVDQTDKSVPPLKGEGAVAFAKNNKDIQADISLYSIGVADKLFKQLTQTLPVADETLHNTLAWNGGRYVLQPQSGKSQMAALYAVAHCMRNPENIKDFVKYLGVGGASLVSQYKLDKNQPPPEYTMAKVQGGAAQAPSGRHHHRRDRDIAAGPRTVYTMAGTNGTFEIELTPKDDYWMVAAGRQTSKVAEKLAQQQIEQTQKALESLNDKKITTKSTEDLILQSTAPTKGEPQKTATTEATKSTVPPVDAASKIVERKSVNTPSVIATNHETRSTPKQETTAPTSDVSPSQNASTTPIESGGETIVVNDRLKLRRGPSTGYRMISEVTPGSKLEVIGKKDGWYKVRSNGREGYVFAGLVDYKKSDGYTTVTVTKSKHVRDSNENSVAKTQPGDKMVILGGLKNNKYKVQLSNGKTGYVDKDAVNVQTEEPQLVP